MKKGTWHCIGLMSGTSLDGVDIAYIKFQNDINLQFEIINAITIPYSKEWKNKLRNAFYSSAFEITKLNVDYGKYLGNLVNDFIENQQISKLDFVASHGHTVFHNPKEGYTLQIGDGATISATCGEKVICDFRTQDVALGGQGAPLVPIGDKLLFSQYDYCINIGGFANISFDDKTKERKAFDICPANIVLNHYAEKMGFAFDENGKIAQNGAFNSELYHQLNNLSFYKNHDSMGFEIVKSTILPLIDSCKLPIPTILNTYTEHIATKISSIIVPDSQVLITGGGALNSYLIERIQNNSAATLNIPDRQLIDFKEALIFGLLGLLKSENEINCLKSVTGASKNHSSGQIFNL